MFCGEPRVTRALRNEVRDSTLGMNRDRMGRADCRNFWCLIDQIARADQRVSRRAKKDAKVLSAEAAEKQDLHHADVDRAPSPDYRLWERSSAGRHGVVLEDAQWYDTLRVGDRRRSMP